MLVLTRKEGQSVKVGGLTVKLIKIQGGRVKLGFEGADDMPVVRTEVLGRDQQQREPVQV